MSVFVARRMLQGVLVLFLVSLLTFFLIHLAPGGPSSLVDFTSTASERDARMTRFGLDRPLHERYLVWLGGAVRGDLGTSINQGLPVSGLLRQRLGTTLSLALAALALAAIVGVALGVLAALNRNRWPDHLVSTISTLGMSVPNFWLGIVAIIVFAVQLGWLPAAGSGPIGQSVSLGDRLRHLAMPAGVLAFSLMPNVVRVTRAAVLEVAAADFVRTARAKGVHERRVLLGHTLRNALVPVVAVIGLITTVLFSGSVVIESVFGWAGLGRLAIEAANGRDYPVILGVTLLAGAVVVSVNILVDLLYAVVDPRIRHG
ncbi:MAG: ABC transporter permease subunit [Deinococcus-Thermus bacterium]|jgi:peptide/nickel transport system permease protein|nr:ABC transporter permease subunit [Deinococcota bacterium]